LRQVKGKEKVRLMTKNRMTRCFYLLYIFQNEIKIIFDEIKI
jgi:hypothetical protein